MADSGLRQVICLQNIPVFPKKISTKDLRSRLSSIDPEFAVTERTINRDINTLASYFPIESYPGEGPGRSGNAWAFNPERNIPVIGMDAGMALTLKLSYDYLAKVTPENMLRNIDPFVGQAEALLNDNKNLAYRSWLKKIRTVQSGFNPLPAEVDSVTANKIFDAVLREKRFSANYNSVSSGKKPRIIDPLAIVNRGHVTYVVCRIDGKINSNGMPLLTALHRYSDVELLDETIKKVPGFNIDEYIADGNLGPKNSGDGLKKFKAKIYKTTATHLMETPIHSSQKISAPDEDGWRTITAELPITHEFRYFLMSYHAEVIVEKPISLRKWMKESVQKMHENYFC